MARASGSLKEWGPPGLPYVLKTKELGTAGHKSDGQENAPKNVFINYVRKLVF